MPQITIGILNEYNFCLMMPPEQGLNVGDTEGTSLARCFGNVAGSHSTGEMPHGFIASAHFKSTNDYVQVSGLLDTSKWIFPAGDTGGQYDSALWGSRPGSTCAGYSSYLEYLEPDYNRYCVRCCHKDSFCDASFDLIGCERGMSGTTFGPGFDSNGQSSDPPPPTKTFAVTTSTMNLISSFTSISTSTTSDTTDVSTTDVTSEEILDARTSVSSTPKNTNTVSDIQSNHSPKLLSIYLITWMCLIYILY